MLSEVSPPTTPSTPERCLAQGPLPEEERSLNGDVRISSCQLIENAESKPFVGYVVNVSGRHIITRPSTFKHFLFHPCVPPHSFSSLPLPYPLSALASLACPLVKRRASCRL